MKGLIILVALLGPVLLGMVGWLTYRYGLDRVQITRQRNALAYAKAGLRQIEKYSFGDEYSKNIAIVTLYEMESVLSENKRSINGD